MKAIVLINPGNPTGRYLKHSTIKKIFKFAHRNNLSVISDEVYMENIYDNQKFISSKKILKWFKDKEIKDNVPLFSLNSVSKGIYGECGMRGGYLELTNVSQQIKENLIKQTQCFENINDVG